MTFRIGDVVRHSGAPDVEFDVYGSLIDCTTEGHAQTLHCQQVGGIWKDSLRADRCTLIRRTDWRAGDRVEASGVDGTVNKPTFGRDGERLILVDQDDDERIWWAPEDCTPLPPCPACEDVRAHCGGHGVASSVDHWGPSIIQSMLNLHACRRTLLGRLRPLSPSACGR